MRVPAAVTSSMVTVLEMLVLAEPPEPTRDVPKRNASDTVPVLTMAEPMALFSTAQKRAMTSPG